MFDLSNSNTYQTMTPHCLTTRRPIASLGVGCVSYFEERERPRVLQQIATSTQTNIHKEIYTKWWIIDDGFRS